MPAPPSATVARLELSTRLRGRRKKLEIDVAEITRACGFTRNYWSQVENDRTLIAEDKLRAVLSLFGTSAADVAEMLSLRELARARSWWQTAGIRSDLQRLYGLEYGADSVRTYEVHMVTGLLQTDDYARALIKASPLVPSVDVERLLAIRMKRQERLAGDDPLQLTAVMSQAALLQHVGDRPILLGQLRHLMDLLNARSATIELRVVPFDEAPGGMTGGSTTYLLTFASQHLTTVVWTEAALDSGFNDDESVIPGVELAYEEARKIALSQEDSLALIEECARDLERRIKRG